jgi:hypothetical protein
METLAQNTHRFETSAPLTALPETSERAGFRKAVTLATLHALDNLPDANGRVERARDLVLTGAVTPHEDGVFVVRGLGTNGKDYTVTDYACTCPDASKANTCKHIIAVWIWRKAEAAVKEHGETPQPASATPSLPEAPASCNVFLPIAGRNVQITLRDHDEYRLLERLKALLRFYPVEEVQEPAAEPEPLPAATPEPPQAEPEPEPPADWCAIHGVTMALRRNAQGSWYSHRLPDGSYCKGR